MAENKGDKSNRGFASMDDDKQRDIASKGGQSVPDEKRSFSQDRELASEAARRAAKAVLAAALRMTSRTTAEVAGTSGRRVRLRRTWQFTRSGPGRWRNPALVEVCFNGARI